MDETTRREVLEARQADPWIGRTLLGSYTILSFLAEGGMGRVYAARHNRTDAELAVKVLRREVVTQPEICQRFRDEARVVSALRHPNVVQVIDFATHDGEPFMVMERLVGEDLEARLARGDLAIEELLEVLRQVGGALQEAHDRGIVHRDIKPQNVFLVADAGRAGAWTKVLDFGIAKVRHSLSLGLTGERALLGTPHYLSPEVLCGPGAARVDGRADQWALGVLTYRALSGQLPFCGDGLAAVMYQIAHVEPVPLRHLAPHVPAELAEVVARAMRKRREERFPEIRDFVAALEAAMSRSGARPGRRMGLVASAAGLLLVGVSSGWAVGAAGKAPVAAVRPVLPVAGPSCPAPAKVERVAPPQPSAEPPRPAQRRVRARVGLRTAWEP